MPETDSIAERVLARCRALGFALAGICEARPSVYGKQFVQWLEAGKHGEMAYLARNVEKRLDPAQLVPGAKSIICVADRYEGHTTKRPSVETSPSGFGKIARYARGDDYHVVMRRRLSTLGRELSSEYPGQVFRACVDTAPVLEREHAQRAGLGAIGKHTLLIAPEMGSWLLLGEIVTTLPLAPAKKVPDTFFDPCGPCTRCIDACPTKAISPWSVDATNCISYLTIEHRGPIDERYHEAMGDWIFGCDICQDVCPHNQPTVRRRQRAAETNPAYDARREGFDLLEVIGWDEAARRQAFTKSALKRATLAMMQRNAAIARKNQET